MENISEEEQQRKDQLRSKLLNFKNWKSYASQIRMFYNR